MNRSLAESAFASRQPWTDRKRLNVFATTVLMLDDEPALSKSALIAVAQGRIVLDPRLVEDFYRSCSREEKIAIVRSTAAQQLPAARFRRLFLDALRKCRPTARERGKLVLALRFHLGANSQAVETYRPTIRRLLRSREGDDRLHALDLVSRLAHAEPDDLALVVAQLKSRSEYERMGALNALAAWARRPGVSVEVRSFAASDEVAKMVRTLHAKDSSSDVRLCAYYYLKSLRQLRASQKTKPRANRR